MLLRTIPTASLLFLCAGGVVLIGDDVVYQKPPKEILDVLHAPSTPLLDVNPSKTHAMLIRMERYPPISEVAAPMLRLAGLRISPATNGPHSVREAESLELLKLADQTKVPITVGPGARIGMPRWSPDGSQFAFTNTTPSGIELWTGVTATGKVKKVDGVKVNAVLGPTFQWTSDNKTLLVQTIPANRPAAPQRPATPRGPKVQESAGRAAGIWTNPDALKDAHDEELFDYYATAQLAWVDSASGKATPYGRPGIFSGAAISPDGAHVLTTRIQRPYTYLHYYTAFPKEVEVWNKANGNVERKVASLPLEDRVPVDGVPVGPRQIQWQATAGATLLWVEALDGGNPKEKVPHRDRVLMWKAPFGGDPKEALKVEQRFMGMTFVGETAVAMVSDLERSRRWVRTLAVNLDNPAEAPKVVFSRDMRDRYRDPGQPVKKLLASGQSVIASKGNFILLDGEGAGPKGSRPFLDRYDISQQKSERLFQSSETSYENVTAVLDEDGSRFITRKESPTEPPNYFLHENGKVVALTAYKDPTPQLRSIKKQLVTYKRPDGVPLSFTLYLPPGYQPGKPLPTVVWAYPLEFNDADTAGQIVGSTQRFTTIASTSHLFFLLQGYAILDNASMPVVGSIEKVNDTYIEQIVASAKAAIDKAAEMGVTDPERVGVGGHSYGGFMTANLLAHSDLFRAGIARSGAYNRTLTPFGFQSERRTLWEAPETYMRMSPFLHAQKIKEPILLIHGEADNNQGTFPIQSERMYQAIRGNGGHVRYVVLPAESHGYGAKESVEHTLWEMLTWFDKHVKNAPARMPGTSPSAGGAN
jgi:dipeptidyl aminopeptidase/acylaminoacyl peptidase